MSVAVQARPEKQNSLVLQNCGAVIGAAVATKTVPKPKSSPGTELKWFAVEGVRVYEHYYVVAMQKQKQKP